MVYNMLHDTSQIKPKRVGISGFIIKNLFHHLSRTKAIKANQIFSKTLAPFTHIKDFF